MSTCTVSTRCKAELKDHTKRCPKFTVGQQALAGVAATIAAEMQPAISAAINREPRAVPDGYRWIELDTRGRHVAQSVGTKTTICGEVLIPRGQPPSIVWHAEGKLPTGAGVWCFRCTELAMLGLPRPQPIAVAVRPQRVAKVKGEPFAHAERLLEPQVLEQVPGEVMIVGMDLAHGADKAVIVTGTRDGDGKITIEQVKELDPRCPAPDEVARASFYRKPADEKLTEAFGSPFYTRPHVWYACKIDKHAQCLQEHPADCPCGTKVGFCSCECHDNG